jgi:ParB-like chromosome segregation protein Spo0J
MTTSKTNKSSLTKPVAKAENASPAPEIFDTRRPSTLTSVALKDIKTEIDEYGLRNKEDLSDAALNDLMESVKGSGIINSLVGSKLPTGGVLLLDGHRRFTVLSRLAEQGVAGFSKGMKVPIVLYDENISKVEKFSIAITSNIDRESLPQEARYIVCLRMHKAGATYAYIAKCMRLSETSVARDVALAEDDVMMAYVTDGTLPASVAAKLLQIAKKKNKVKEVHQAVAKFRKQGLAKIKREREERKAKGKPPLSEAEQRPRRYFTEARKNTWLNNLANGEPLGEPEFTFAAGVSDDGMITVKGITAKVDAIGRSGVIQMVRSCTELLVDLTDRLKQTSAAPAAEEKQKRSTKFLRMLGIDGLDEEETPDPELEAKWSDEPSVSRFDDDGEEESPDVEAAREDEEPGLDDEVEDEAEEGDEDE